MVFGIFIDSPRRIMQKPADSFVNRQRPQLFTPYLVKGGNVDGGSDADDVWLQHLVSPGEWLEHTTFQNLTTLVRTVVVHNLCFHPPLTAHFPVPIVVHLSL